MSKQYIAIYDELKLFSDFFHNNLERMHQYDVLFSTESEANLFIFLTSQVKLLLFHASQDKEKVIQLTQLLIDKYRDLKVLIYSKECEEIEPSLLKYKNRIRVVSVRKGYGHFYEAMK